MHALPSRTEKIRQNYQQVCCEMATAASAASRKPEEIRLVAVTKYVGAADAMALVEAGCVDLGESRPQSVWEKSASLPSSVRWHLIGHLQRNKVRRTLPRIHLLHSLDSMRLTEAMAEEAVALEISVSVLLEIHIAQDTSKTGMPASEAEAWLARYISDEQIRRRIALKGLMGMSTLGAQDAQVRREFELLRTHRETWNRRFGLNMSELSMGMSQDFPLAIAEGSTIVRVGSRLFDGLPET